MHWQVRNDFFSGVLSSIKISTQISMEKFSLGSFVLDLRQGPRYLRFSQGTPNHIKTIFPMPTTFQGKHKVCECTLYVCMI